MITRRLSVSRPWDKAVFATDSFTISEHTNTGLWRIRPADSATISDSARATAQAKHTVDSISISDSA